LSRETRQTYLDQAEDLALVGLVDAVENQSLVEPFDVVPFQEDDSNHHVDPQVLVDPEDPVVVPFVVDLDPVETTKCMNKFIKNKLKHI